MYHVSAQGVDERVIMNSIGSICRLRMVVLSIFMQQALLVFVAVVICFEFEPPRV